MSWPAKQYLGSPAMTLSEYGCQTTFVYMEHPINITISEQNCYNYMIHKYINLIWGLRVYLITYKQCMFLSNYQEC